MFLGVLSGLCAGALWGFVFLVPKLLVNYSSADIALGRYVVFEHLASSTSRLLAWPYVSWMLVIGAGSSWLAIYFWNFACRRIPTALAGQLIVSEVVFSLLYNYVYDWRLPLMHEFAAAIALIAGVIVGIHAFRAKSV